MRGLLQSFGDARRRGKQVLYEKTAGGDGGGGGSAGASQAVPQTDLSPEVALLAEVEATAAAAAMVAGAALAGLEAAESAVMEAMDALGGPGGALQSELSSARAVAAAEAEAAAAAASSAKSCVAPLRARMTDLERARLDLDAYRRKTIALDQRAFEQGGGEADMQRAASKHTKLAAAAAAFDDTRMRVGAELAAASALHRTRARASAAELLQAHAGYLASLAAALSSPAATSGAGGSGSAKVVAVTLSVAGAGAADDGGESEGGESETEGWVTVSVVAMAAEMSQ